MTPDWYEVLGVERDADHATVHAAYLAQARRHHPDARGGSTARMQLLNDAWEILGDPVRRAGYDRTLPVRESGVLDAGGFEGAGPRPVAVEEDPAGAPVVGVARAVIAFAPLCFVGGIVVFGAGVVLQVAGIVQAGLLVLLASLIAFAMAPFLAMGASRHRSGTVTDVPSSTEPPGGTTVSKVAIIAKITAKDGQRDALRDVFASTGMANAAAEPGTEIYALNEDQNDPDVLWFYEVYTDGDALAAHGSSDAMKALGGEIREYMAARPELTFLNFVTAEGL